MQYRENCYRTNWWRLTQSAEQFSVECQKWPVTVFPSSVLFLAILSDDTFVIWYWASEIQSHKSLEWSICNHYNHFGCRCSRCRCYYYCLSYFFFPLFFTGRKNEHSSFLFYTQLKIAHLVQGYLCIVIAFFYSIMRIMIQCPSIYTVQKAEADKWPSRYHFLLWRLPMKDFMIFHHDSEVVSKLASALPHLLCVQVSCCWERNEIKWMEE